MPIFKEDIIYIDDGEDQSPSKRRRGQVQTSVNYVDLDEAEFSIPIMDPDKDQVIEIYDVDDELEDKEYNTSKPVWQESKINQQDSPSGVLRNPPVVMPWVEIECYKWHKYSLRKGKTVELKDGSFLHIHIIIQNQLTESILLRGWKLVRTHTLDGLLPRKMNELCFIYDVDLDDKRPIEEQNIHEVRLEDVLRIRKLTKTNKPFPACRYNPSNVKHIRTSNERKSHIMQNEVLVVRWKYVSVYHTAYDMINFANKYRCKQLETLRDDECTPSYSESSEARLLAWRNESPKGGSIEPRFCLTKVANPPNVSHRGSKASSNSSPEIPNANSSSRSKYTFGDIFSGAGGMTRGAFMAGLAIKFGLDFDPNPMETWRWNFPSATAYNCTIHKFVVLTAEKSPRFVVILHLSPPCQVFSPIHTRIGKNDDMNFASLYAVWCLLEKLRPRIVTLEQTFGIVVQKKFQHAFNALIHMFTNFGFSVSWQVISFEKFGLAQRRKRLIIVAAAPGESLPSFPEYTHGENGIGGLKPYTSVRSVLNSVPLRAPNHDPQAAIRGQYDAWDASGIVNCITCNGGERRSHPDGHRLLTAREIAALQGFPHNHEFRGKDIKRQIGNAVPPCIGAIILRSIKEHLERVDGNRGGDILIV
ncbi:hypothetical protein B7463_g4421, partial [Scytalidium lignicola]